MSVSSHISASGGSIFVSFISVSVMQTRQASLAAETLACEGAQPSLFPRALSVFPQVQEACHRLLSDTLS